MQELLRPQEEPDAQALIDQTRKDLGEAEAEIAQATPQLDAARSALAAITVEVANWTPQAEKLRQQAADLESQIAAAQQELQKAKSDNEPLRLHVKNLDTLFSRLEMLTVHHWRNAGALTCFVFALIGVPLGILSRRGNVLMAFVISFFTVLIIYYPLMVIGQMLAQDGYADPMLAMWAPNAVIGAVAMLLLTLGVRR